MMADVYNAFIDPANWLHEDEIKQLSALYGWGAKDTATAPHGLPAAPVHEQRKTPPS
jgi:hypothetical protein